MDLSLYDCIEVKHIKAILQSAGRPELLLFFNVLVEHIDLKNLKVDLSVSISSEETSEEESDNDTDEEWVSQNA